MAMVHADPRSRGQNVGLGVNWYFRDWWNRFDFSLVVLSVLTIALDVVNNEHYCGDEEFAPRVLFPGLSVLRVRTLKRGTIAAFCFFCSVAKVAQTPRRDDPEIWADFSDSARVQAYSAAGQFAADG